MANSTSQYERIFTLMQLAEEPERYISEYLVVVAMMLLFSNIKWLQWLLVCYMTTL